MKPKDNSHRAAFIDAFFDGLALPGFLFYPREPSQWRIDAPRNRNRLSDRDAMRGDWRRVCADFNRVIARETATDR